MILYFLAAFSFLSLAWLAYKKPTWALYCIIALLPSYLLRLNFYGFPTTILEMLILGIGVGIIAHNLHAANRQKNLDRLKTIFLKEKYWLIILAVILISSVSALVISPDKMKALGLAKAYLWEPIFLFILMLIYWQKENLEKAILFLIPASLLINFLNIYQFIKKEGLMEFDGFSHNLRVTGHYDYPNAVGLFLSPITLLFAYLLFKYWQNKKYLYAGLISFLILGNFLSIYWAQSEAALLALLLSGFLVALNFKYLRILAIVMAITVSGLAYQFNYLEKIQEKLTLQDFSGQIRQHIYMESSEMLLDNFWLGSGLGGYQTVMKNYHLDVLIMKKDNKIFEQPVEIYLYPHNIILNFWTELGFFAMLSFIFIIIYYIGKNYLLFIKEKNLLTIFLASTLLSILIHGFFDVPYFKNDLAIFFWLLMGASLILNIDHTEEKSK